MHHHHHDHHLLLFALNIYLSMLTFIVGLYYFQRIRMVMPPVADSSVQTAVLSIAILYLGLVLTVGARLAFVLGEGDGGHPKWIRLWGLVTITVQQILYLPILSMLFSVLQCGIVNVRGIHLYSSFFLHGPDASV